MRDLEIVIVSHKRAELLKRTLDSVSKALSLVEFEVQVRVLLNGVDRESEALLNTLSNTSTLKFYQHSDTLGPAAARNFLAAKARSADPRWILFLDDDCAVPENFFQKWQRIVTGPAAEAHVIGGPNITFPNATAFENASGRVLASRFASQRSAWRYRETSAHFRCTDVELTSTHLFVRADVLKEYSYPEGFQTAEENAFLHAVREKYKNIYYFGDLHVYHERRATLTSFAWQIFRYGRGRGQMVRDGYAFEWFHIAPAVFMFTFLAALFSPTHFLIYFLAVFALVYGSALAIASVAARTFWAPLLFFLVHASYVSGWWWGFVFKSSPRTLSAPA